MQKTRYLVIGATGHVGSKTAILLADRGHDVTAMVRTPGATIRDPHRGQIRYVAGDLRDEQSLKAALRGIDVVVSSANGVVPQRRGGSAGDVNQFSVRLIDLCEQAGVRRFVQSSVPPFKHEHRVPELIGKRRIEARLQRSTMQSIIIRNAAFMDVFLVMGGFKQAADRCLHATTARQYGFVKLWMKLVGNLTVKHGLFIAPGGPQQGTPIICTRDVAELMYAAAIYEKSDSRLIEAGGPQWLTWHEIAQIIAQKIGRKSVRVITAPALMARFNQLVASPFSPAIANTFGLMNFVASFQPRWESPAIVREWHLPPQWTVSDYLDAQLAQSKT